MPLLDMQILKKKADKMEGLWRCGRCVMYYVFGMVMFGMQGWWLSGGSSGTSALTSTGWLFIDRRHLHIEKQCKP